MWAPCGTPLHPAALSRPSGPPHGAPMATPLSCGRPSLQEGAEQHQAVLRSEEGVGAGLPLRAAPVQGGGNGRLPQADPVLATAPGSDPRCLKPERLCRGPRDSPGSGPQPALALAGGECQVRQAWGWGQEGRCCRRRDLPGDVLLTEGAKGSWGYLERTGTQPWPSPCPPALVSRTLLPSAW